MFLSLDCFPDDLLTPRGLSRLSIFYLVEGAKTYKRGTTTHRRLSNMQFVHGLGALEVVSHRTFRLRQMRHALLALLFLLFVLGGDIVFLNGA